MRSHGGIKSPTVTNISCTWLRFIGCGLHCFKAPESAQHPHNYKTVYFELQFYGFALTTNLFAKTTLDWNESDKWVQMKTVLLKGSCLIFRNRVIWLGSFFCYKLITRSGSFSGESPNPPPLLSEALDPPLSPPCRLITHLSVNFDGALSPNGLSFVITRRLRPLIEKKNTSPKKK